MGIEPTYLAWKASVLPLNYTCILITNIYDFIGVTGFEPATSWSQTRRSSQAEPHPGVVTQDILYSTVALMSTVFSNFLYIFRLNISRMYLSDIPQFKIGFPFIIYRHDDISRLSSLLPWICKASRIYRNDIAAVRLR